MKYQYDETDILRVKLAADHTDDLLKNFSTANLEISDFIARCYNAKVDIQEAYEDQFVALTFLPPEFWHCDLKNRIKYVQIETSMGEIDTRGLVEFTFSSYRVHLHDPKYHSDWVYPDKTYDERCFVLQYKYMTQPPGSVVPWTNWENYDGSDHQTEQDQLDLAIQDELYNHLRKYDEANADNQ